MCTLSDTTSYVLLSSPLQDVPIVNYVALVVKMLLYQGGRSWEPFSESKKGHIIFVRRIFAIFATNKRVIFARNCKIANVIQHDMRYVPRNSAFVARETLILTKKKHCILPRDKIFQKVCKSRQILKSRQNSVC